MSFNSACYCISIHAYSQAQSYLKNALSLCKTYIENENETSAEVELCMIKAQIALVYQLQSKFNEAKTLYDSILLEK